MAKKPKSDSLPENKAVTPVEPVIFNDGSTEIEMTMADYETLMLLHFRTEFAKSSDAEMVRNFASINLLISMAGAEMNRRGLMWKSEVDGEPTPFLFIPDDYRTDYFTNPDGPIIH